MFDLFAAAAGMLVYTILWELLNKKGGVWSVIRMVLCVLAALYFGGFLLKSCSCS